MLNLTQSLTICSDSIQTDFRKMQIMHLLLTYLLFEYHAHIFNCITLAILAKMDNF